MQVVIPIGVGSNWSNNELRYCLRSISKHCKFDVEPIILADEGVSIPWLTNVVCVPITRFYPQGLEEKYGMKMYENYFDTSHKLKWFSEQDFCGDNFLWMYDDQLILQDITDVQIFDNVAVGKIRSGRKSRHDKTIIQAMDISHRERCHNGLWISESHAPRYYNKAKLQRMFRCYPFETMDVPYALYTTYRNIYYDDPKSVIMDESCRLICYYHFDDGTPHHQLPDTMGEIDDASKKYYTLNFTDKGLNATGELLKRWIISAYPDKCKYEL